MNNNQMNFDPMTGQPINQNTNNTVIPNSANVPLVQPVPTVEQVQQTQTIAPIQTIEQPQNTNTLNTQQQMQSIPTVEQSKQEFINNTQANSVVKKEEKTDGPNIIFIIVLFVIILAAILFLFPYLMKVL